MFAEKVCAVLLFVGLQTALATGNASTLEAATAKSASNTITTAAQIIGKQNTTNIVGQFNYDPFYTDVSKFTEALIATLNELKAGHMVAVVREIFFIVRANDSKTRTEQLLILYNLVRILVNILREAPDNSVIAIQKFYAKVNVTATLYNPANSIQKSSTEIKKSDNKMLIAIAEFISSGYSCVKYRKADFVWRQIFSACILSFEELSRQPLDVTKQFGQPLLFTSLTAVNNLFWDYGLQGLKTVMFETLPKDELDELAELGLVDCGS